MPCEAKRYGLVYFFFKSSRHFLTSNHCFWLKYESSLHTIAFSSENGLIWIRREICTDQALFTSKKLSKTVLNKYAGGFRSERTGMDHINYWLIFWLRFKVKKPWWICFYKHAGFHFTRHSFKGRKEGRDVLLGQRKGQFSANFHFWVNYSFNSVVHISVSKML